MPSPEDLVTAAQVSEMTGIPTRVISTWADNRYLKSQGIIRQGVVGKNMGSRGISKGRPVRSFLWKDVAELLSRYRPGTNDLEAVAKATPEGYIHVTDAASILGVRETFIRANARDGRIPCKLVPMNGVSSRRNFVFVLKSKIEELRAKADKRHTSSRPTYGITEPPPDTSNPLISADDEVCLEARLKLWNEKGRVLPKKYRISVARRSMAG